MTHELATFGSTPALVSPETMEYVKASKSESTRRANTTDWRDFLAWCEGEDRHPLPATQEAIAEYLAHMATDHKVSTIRRHLSSIGQAHDAAGIEINPARSLLVRATVRGIANTLGIAPTQKKATRTADLRAMVEKLRPGLSGLRDRALLLVGFAGAFRRSELVGLNVEDLEISLEGLTIALRRSKTDQEGQGMRKAIHYGDNAATCPVRALQAWLEGAGITTGAIFRKVNKGGNAEAWRLTDKSVALIIKRAAESVGLDASSYSGHSLRAGCATEAAAAGAADRDIQRQTGHKSAAMVQRYIREGSLFRNNVTSSLGL
jgi:site-specific recombinase XerD